MPLSPRDRLRAAGLDPGLATTPGPGERYCPYTGRALLVSGGSAGDSGRLGLDAFTATGRPLRYAADGARAEPLDQPLDLSDRTTRDLWAASALALPERALSTNRPAKPAERWQLVAPGLGQVRSVVTRHGRLWALISYGPAQHAIHCWQTPDGATAPGWRPPRLRGNLLPLAADGPGSELRVAETLVYLATADRLLAWHAGTGEVWLDWPWPGGTRHAVRIAYDRVLHLNEDQGRQIAAVYDLRELAGGSARPLAGQQLALGQPAGEAQPVWAEAVDEQFVVLTGDGRLVVYPFDGEPRELFANTEQVHLARPSLADGPEGPRVLAYARTDRGQWLLEALLDGRRPPFFQPLGEAPRASRDMAPIVLGGRLLTAHAADEENVTIGRCAAGQAATVDLQTAIPGTGGSRLDGLARVLTRGRELVWVVYSETTFRHWLGDGQLQRADLEPPWPRITTTDEIRLLWDAAGVYLCNLTDGVVYARSPA